MYCSHRDLGQNPIKFLSNVNQCYKICGLLPQYTEDQGAIQPFVQQIRQKGTLWPHPGVSL